MFRKEAAKKILAVAKWSAKTSVRQSSDWYHYQMREPDGLKNWKMEQFGGNAGRKG